MWNTQKMEYYLAFKKKETVICDNMGESWGHFVKWNNLVTERQILQGSIYMTYV